MALKTGKNRLRTLWLIFLEERPLSIDSDEDTGTHQVKSEATSSSECLTEAIGGGNETS